MHRDSNRVRCAFFLFYRPNETEVRPTGKYRYLTFEDRKKIEAWHLIGDRPADIVKELIESFGGSFATEEQLRAAASFMLGTLRATREQEAAHE